MNHTLSIISSFIFLGIGLAAVIIMLNLLGNPKERPGSSRLKTMHRILGYAFFLFFLINLVFMAQRLVGFTDEPSPRLLLHITLALFLIPVFLVKISIARFFKKLYPYLMPTGLIIFVFSFIMIAITAVYALITSADIT